MQDEEYDDDYGDADEADSSDALDGPQPWWTLTVLMGLLGTLLIWPLVAFALFLLSPLPRLIYGEEFVQTAQTPSTPAGEQAALRLNMWTVVGAFPIQAVLLPLFFWLVHRSRPEEMNLTTRRAGWNFLLGFGAWLILTPLTLALHFLATTLYDRLFPAGTEPHVFEQLVRENALWPSEKVLIALAAMLVAPVIEEQVFRGVLLRWARQCSYASDLIVTVAVVACMPTSEASWRGIFMMADARSVLHPLAPLIWGVLVASVYSVVRWLHPETAAPRMIATALLFASFHGAWPSPVPLFFLALGLAYLAEKTDSLVGPITVHCLFNGVACAQMFLVPDG